MNQSRDFRILSGKQSLTFNDGLNFGCGFFVAGFMFFVCALPLGALATVTTLAVLGRVLEGL